MDDRPGTRFGPGPGAGFTSSSGRPRTSRPHTSARPTTSGVGQQQYTGEEYNDDEEEYETEDDGDVFAFIPPDLGPSAQTVALSGANVDIAHDQQHYAMQNTGHAQQQAPYDEDALFVDDATGAVYDAQGRRVNVQADFSDPSAARTWANDHPLQYETRGQAALYPGGDTSERAQAEILPSPSAARLRGEHESVSVPMHNAGAQASTNTFPALSRQASFASSHFRDMEAPILPRARPISGFPDMEEVPELSHNGDGTSSHRTGSRNVGMTARGAAQLDELGVDQAGVLRRRTNHQSANADGGPTPSQELTSFPLDKADTQSLEDLDAKAKLGGGQGAAHLQMPFEGLDVGPKGLRMVELEMETEEDSPYPEVRASVSNIDDPDMPVSTFRAWFLCFVLGTLAGGINMLLNLRYPAPILSPIVMQLIAYPCGKLMAAVLPIRTVHMPRWLGGFSFSLNPGLFNIKEHALITIVMNLTIQQAYGIYATTVLNSPAFYNRPRPVLFSILFVLSSQLIGFCFAGISRRFLVWPASMMWPQNLVIATILNTLHAEEDDGDGTISRFRYFSLVFGGAVIWYFVPGFLFQAVSAFGWLCWIWPNNFIVNTVFGVQSGLGLSVLTFDWNQINYTGSPLVYPWWAECNIFAGFIIWMCIFAPTLYFTNTLFTAYMPFNSGQSYDNHGQPYDVTRIVSPDNKLDVAAYESYSPLFLPATYVTTYMISLGAATAVLSHTILYHGKALWRGIRYIKTEEDDIHAKYMRRYPEVPEWWYLTIGLSMFAVSVVAIEVYDTGLPVWGLLIALMIPALYILPSGFIYAMTGSVIGTNLIGELVAGYAMPGNPVANVMFKVYALQTLSSGLSFIQDLKLGHYMKIPPRHSFAVQVIFSIWVVIVQIGVQQFMQGHVSGLCTPDQEHHFTCPHARVFFTSSVVWGIIGPRRLFGTGGLYTPLYWALLGGALLPIPFWLMARKFPKSWIKFVSVPIALNGATFMPPASGLVYTAWFAVAFVFQYLIRRYKSRWWSKYNFVTSAALDSGTIVSTIVIFLVLQLPKGGNITLSWWGNSVAANTLDAQGISWMQPPAEGFGPAPKA